MSVKSESVDGPTVTDEFKAAAELETETSPLHKFSTGAVRSTDADAYRFDLISPIALRRIAARYALGSKKYGDSNWERGMPISDLANHALRHLFLYLSGDRSDDHLAGVAWGACAMLHSEELWPQMNQNLRRAGCIPLNVTDEQAEAWGAPYEG
jgi:Domain of unknown function (DUF5664)